MPMEIMVAIGGQEALDLSPCQQAEHPRVAEPFFQDTRQHVLAEIERLNLSIRFQICRLRGHLAPDDAFRGLYISDEEIERLSTQPLGPAWWLDQPSSTELRRFESALSAVVEKIAALRAESIRRGIRLRLDELTDRFELTPFDRDAVLVCLAPEIDLRYERFYAYLQDDVTQKRPSVDLVLNLLVRSIEEKITARARFEAEAPLLRHGILALVDDAAQHRSSLLGKYAKLEERIVSFLIGTDLPDGRLQTFVEPCRPELQGSDLVLPPGTAECFSGLASHARTTEKPLLIYLHGPAGVGKKTAAAAVCRELHREMLVVEAGRIELSETLGADGNVFQLVEREARLRHAVTYWNGVDGWLQDDAKGLRSWFLRNLAKRPGVTFLAGARPWQPLDELRDLPFLSVAFELPGKPERIALWSRGFDEILQRPEEEVLERIAGRYRLSGDQIFDALATVRRHRRLNGFASEAPSLEELGAACQSQSGKRLGNLAQRIETFARWEDLVLPFDQIRQLREICDRVQCRSRVLRQWGFAQKLPTAKGLTALFAGPSGTGKTMAAGILARELGLLLYRIDLSAVVSKYIGETEKHLAAIFDEAEASNAILFFDEADALFGKRTEVKDAHDRYANIETSYLLQRIEDFDGIVILATNLRNNMDEAFVRRIAFTITLPVPDESARLLIWYSIWPPQTPLAEDVDLSFLARQFKLVGGNIRNIALSSAFLAAREGTAVQMAHLIRATWRELEKAGRTCVTEDFGPYAAFLRNDVPAESVVNRLPQVADIDCHEGCQ